MSLAERRIMREDTFLNNLTLIKSHKNMPFTVSHAVAVIPLYKYLGKFGALSALIIGSMTPDIAYLTPYLVHQRMESHSLVGVYLFAIPMGLTIYFTYHLLVAPVIVSLLPKFIQNHLHQDLFIGRLPNIPSYTLIFSIVLGALTHILWDFFTDQSGIPQYIPWMEIPLTSIDGYNIMSYRVFQHFSTLFGLSLLMFWFWKWLAKKKQDASLLDSNIENAKKWQAPVNLKRFSLIVLGVVPAIFGITNGLKNLSGSTVMYGLYDAQLFLRYGIVGAAGAFIISCILLGFFYQFYIRKNPKYT